MACRSYFLPFVRKGWGKQKVRFLAVLVTLKPTFLYCLYFFVLSSQFGDWVEWFNLSYFVLHMLSINKISVVFEIWWYGIIWIGSIIWSWRKIISLPFYQMSRIVVRHGFSNWYAYHYWFANHCLLVCVFNKKTKIQEKDKQ